MKLRTKFALVLLIVALLLSAGVYGGLELYKQQLVAGTQGEVDETATLAAAQIDADLREQKDFVGYVASRPATARFDRSDRVLREFVTNSRFFAAQIVAANGTVVDINGDITQDVRTEAVGQDVSNRTYVQRALDGEIYVSETQYVNATDEHLLVFSAPIIHNETVRGVFAAAIYVDQLTFLGSTAPLETTDQTVGVTDGSRQLLVPRSSFDRAVIATATVETVGWQVRVTRDRSRLLTRLRWLAVAQGAGLLLVLASIVAFGVWEYRTTLRQTERLLSGFEALGRGEYDYSLSLEAADEWERIGAGFNDLTEGLAAREAELRENEQRLQVLNRVLRHNLRNDLGVVLGYAGIIADETDDSSIREAANHIHATGTELVELGETARQIEETMAERESGGTVTVDVAAAVASAIDPLRETYPAVDFSTTYPDEAWVAAVPSIDLAFEQLCENACKHNEGPGRHVEVTVTADADTVSVTVADDGPGLPDLEQRVIEAGRETPLEHGQGLGLWLVHWTVDRSGGTLRFEPNEPTGTVVRLELARTGPPK